VGKKPSVTIGLLSCVVLTASAGRAKDASARSVDVVVEWNRTLLSILRTPGAQPATVHPTRSFAVMHAAIYDAVNSIDRTHTPYVAMVPRGAHDASSQAAASAAAHRVLVTLYPKLASALDAEFQQSLAHTRIVTRPKAFGLERRRRIRSLCGAARMARTLSQFHTALVARLATTNRRRRIFRSSRSSRIGRW